MEIMEGSKGLNRRKQRHNPDETLKSAPMGTHQKFIIYEATIISRRDARDLPLWWLSLSAGFRRFWRVGLSPVVSGEY